MNKPMSPCGDSALELLEVLGLRDRHCTKLQLTMEPGQIVTVDAEMEVQEMPQGEWKRRLERFVLVDRDEYVRIRKAQKHFRIRHADGGRWRTLDSIGMPDWTDDPAEALTFTLRKHADAFAGDDPEDVRIEEVLL